MLASADTTGATDQANITTALASGTPVRLSPGTYYIKAPLVMPDRSCLMADNPSWGIPTGNYGAGNTAGGWSILNGADSRYIGCRGSSNANVNGWTLTTTGGFTGTVTFIGCEANFNGTGIAVTGRGSTGTYVLDTFRANGNTLAWSYGAGSAMNINSNAAWNTSTSRPAFI